MNCRNETIEPCHAGEKPAEAEMKIDPTKNTIVCGDNLKWLNDIPDDSIDLCYIDPPFFSNAKYEKVWGNGWEVASFEDRFKGGVLEYIAWMKPRIELIHKKLKKNGSMFLHCDWHASHRLRILLDDVFGDDKFVNEIVWHYYNKMQGNIDYFPSNHDTIFWYAKGKDKTFHALHEEREEPVKQLVRKWDGASNKLINAKDKNGKCIYQIKDDRRVDSVWTMPMLQPADRKERIGYKTQKPELLLNMIISACSNEGDVVLDCFAGGGTTAKVCADLGRKFICGDVSPVACKVGAKRLNKAEFYDYEIKGMYQTEQEFRDMNPHDFADMICDLMGWKSNPKKIGDGGIDGWDGNGNPVQIKNWKRNAGAHDLRDFKGALEHHKTGIFINWGFVEGKTGVYEYIREQKDKHGITIEVRKCTELIGDLLIANEKRQQIEQFYAEKVPEDWKDVPLTQDVNLSNASIA